MGAFDNLNTRLRLDVSQPGDQTIWAPGINVQKNFLPGSSYILRGGLGAKLLLPTGGTTDGHIADANDPQNVGRELTLQLPDIDRLRANGTIDDQQAAGATGGTERLGSRALDFGIVPYATATAGVTYQRHWYNLGSNALLVEGSVGPAFVRHSTGSADGRVHKLTPQQYADATCTPDNTGGIGGGRHSPGGCANVPAPDYANPAARTTNDSAFNLPKTSGWSTDLDATVAGGLCWNVLGFSVCAEGGVHHLGGDTGPLFALTVGGPLGGSRSSRSSLGAFGL